MKITSEKTIRVVCIGDSITQGFGLGTDATQFYPGKLQKMLGPGYEVFNKGVTSSCVTNTKNEAGDVVGLPYVKQKKYQEALELKGDIYIILLGTNDAQDGMYDECDKQDPRNIIISYEKQFCSYYQDILDAIKKANPDSQIFICKPVPVIDCIWRKHQQKYMDILLPHFDEILKNNPECCLIDIFKSFISYKKQPLKTLYQRDGLHPNLDGAQLIAETVYDALMKEKSVSNSGKFEVK